MKRIALIPAYEPGEILIQIVNQLYNEQFEIVVVDDGSGDAYQFLFNQLQEKAKVLSYAKNCGKGYALKKGLEYINQNYVNVTVVTMDADGQHQVSDAIKICREVEGFDSEFVIGARDISHHCPTKSWLGNSITRIVYRLITKEKVYDTQSGLRGFSSTLIPMLMSVSGNRYEYEMKVLLTLAKNQIPISEIPIETIYFDKKNSVSHFNALVDSFKIYSEIIKFAGSSLLSYIIEYSMYLLLLLLLGTRTTMVVASNLGARTVSSIVNFTINKKIVFKSKGSMAGEAFLYFVLLIMNIMINSAILGLITSLGCNAYYSKIMVDFIMFFFNYIVQHFLIFKNKSAVDFAGRNGD